MRRTTAFIFLALGLSCLLITTYLIWQRYTPTRLSFNLNVTATGVVNSHNQPQELIIPDLNLHLAILPAKINRGKWEATDKGISHLISSPIPGDVGNSILYGHNWPRILGNLPKVRPGQKLFIILSNGEVRAFQIEFTAIVTPDQTHILDQTKDARLTLYTCTGFLDSQRFVVTAIPSKI